MKSLRVSLAFLTLFYVGFPTLRAQDLSKYRVFSLGTSLLSSRLISPSKGDSLQPSVPAMQR
jgi:predicted exporter